MTLLAVTLAISLGMQLVAFVCPSASNFSRKTADSLLVGLFLLAIFLVLTVPILHLHQSVFVFAVVLYFALRSAWPAGSRWQFRQFFDLAISLPLGIGTISFLWLMWVVLGGRNASVPFTFMVCAISLTGSAFLTFFRHNLKTETPQEFLPESERHYVIEISAAVAGLCSFSRIVWGVIVEPLGKWDAWMLWNARAHFLFRSGSDWINQFSGHDTFSWLHPDYPLLLPASVSAMWQLKGQESASAPMIISGLFTVAVIAILMIGVALLRTRNQGYLAGMALMSLGELYLWGCSQQADVPLAAYILAALVCYSLYETKNQKGLLYLSGTFTGMAAWTKNEGALFAILFVLAAIIGSWQTSQTTFSRLKNLVPLAFGILPWALLLLAFKKFLAPETELFHQSSAEILARLLNPERYSLILTSFFNDFNWFGLPFLVLYGLTFGLRFPSSKLKLLLVIIATIIGMLVGYLFACVISPWEPSKILFMTGGRLFLQFWPSLLLLFFLIVRTPEDLYRALSKGSAEIDGAIFDTTFKEIKNS